ncbi:hypothetical protein LSH36_442g02042 [Paralvinella palmiformis]|uniref:Uncharacterized protein n=1 Tax=Paralvinella palmiformis TaxID=53620 RepID=A0AAD9JCB6_9ANNE|nr:hypothetical protein LSH36_442g02042 [Paralvinella palmiformis]
MASKDISSSDKMTTTVQLRDQNLDEKDINKLNVTKLSLAADYYSNICPGLSRYYMGELNDLLSNTGVHKLKVTKDVCIHCGQIFRPGNHTKRLKPRIKRTKKIRQIENKSKKSKNKLGKYQRQLLETYTTGFNYVVARCGGCNKITKYKLYSRDRRTMCAIKQEDHSGSVTLTKKQKKKLKAKKRRAEKQSCSTESPRIIEDIVVTPATAQRQVKATRRTTPNTVNEILKQTGCRKSKKKANQSFSKLQAILSKEQKDKKLKENGGNLADFLSSLS